MTSMMMALMSTRCPNSCLCVDFAQSACVVAFERDIAQVVLRWSEGYLDQERNKPRAHTLL